MLLGMSLMLGTGIPAYAKTVDATVVEQSTKEEGYKEEIGETLKEGFRQDTKREKSAGSSIIFRSSWGELLFSIDKSGKTSL